MKFIYNDGGRAKAGYKGEASDCVTRSIAIATGLPYQQVYDEMAHGNETQRKPRLSARARARKHHNARTAAHGIIVQRKWFKDFMHSIGWVWVPTMGIGTGCTVHLNSDELPKGRLIVSVSRHYTAVIDGVIHDTFNPSERGTTIYPASTPVGNLPKLARKLPGDSGWAYKPERCVYGYWKQA